MTSQSNLAMIDTIAAMTKVEGLDVSLFPGRAETQNEETRKVSARWYRNDPGCPRITYYPASAWLRVEWSAQQMGYGEVDAYLVRGLSGSYANSVQHWQCQRVDYCTEFADVVVQPYLAAIGTLRVGSLARVPFEDGVVWKARQRWIKFYHGKRHGRPNALRFEISNYKQSVRYMAEQWFGCERTVEEMVRPGRALYVLAKYFERLGLHQGFAQQEQEVSALRACFGQRSLAGAIHALNCIRVYGTESYKSLMLMSKSSYYRWYKQLSDEGFLASSDSDLSALSLSCESVFELGAQNLKARLVPPVEWSLPKSAQKNVWKNVAENLGVKPDAPRVKYLEEAYRAWKPGYGLDAKPREVEEKRSVINLSITPSSALVGVSTGLGQPGRSRSLEVAGSNGGREFVRDGSSVGSAAR